MLRAAHLTAALGRRCAPRAVACAPGRAATHVPLAPRCWHRAGGANAQALRSFSEAAGFGLGEGEPARPKPQKKARSPVLPAMGAVLIGGTGAYFVSEDARAAMDGAFTSVGEAFEDFNDSSREFFEGIGDRLVSKREEPWLLDLATMKYPENIPTLVLDVDRVVAFLDHDSRQGWHVIKRPFADQFFREISHYYEIVLFSDDVFPVASDIAFKWNLPVTGVLHRDFCKKKRNHYVKDISKLGRNLERVLIIDHDPAAFQLQPQNGIQIKPFDGDPKDSELADLLEFLKAAATSNQDIRTFAQKFGGGDVDIGRRYLLHKQEQDALVEKRRSLGRVFASPSGFPSRPPTSQFGPGGLR
mmetsp:Transcript_17194/g.60003  ORF Transcript_17194/g.60003 Transcript_17194/m.60003 type:complete len:358 (-) Transcript_17194:168-1241(-)